MKNKFLFEIAKVRPSWKEVPPNEFGDKGWEETPPYYLNLLGVDIEVTEEQAVILNSKIQNYDEIK